MTGKDERIFMDGLPEGMPMPQAIGALRNYKKKRSNYYKQGVVEQYAADFFRATGLVPENVITTYIDTNQTIEFNHAKIAVEYLQTQVFNEQLFADTEALAKSNFDMIATCLMPQQPEVAEAESKESSLLQEMKTEASFMIEVLKDKCRDLRFVYVQNDEETREYGFEPDRRWEGTEDQIENRFATGVLEKPEWWDIRYDWIRNYKLTGKYETPAFLDNMSPSGDGDMPQFVEKMAAEANFSEDAIPCGDSVFNGDNTFIGMKRRGNDNNESKADYEKRIAREKAKKAHEDALRAFEDDLSARENQTNYYPPPQYNNNNNNNNDRRRTTRTNNNNNNRYSNNDDGEQARVPLFGNSRHMENQDGMVNGDMRVALKKLITTGECLNSTYKTFTTAGAFHDTYYDTIFAGLLTAILDAKDLLMENSGRPKPPPDNPNMDRDVRNMLKKRYLEQLEEYERTREQRDQTNYTIAALIGGMSVFGALWLGHNFIVSDVFLNEETMKRVHDIYTGVMRNVTSINKEANVHSATLKALQDEFNHTFVTQIKNAPTSLFEGVLLNDLNVWQSPNVTRAMFGTWLDHAVDFCKNQTFSPMETEAMQRNARDLSELLMDRDRLMNASILDIANMLKSHQIREKLYNKLTPEMREAYRIMTETVAGFVNKFGALKDVGLKHSQRLADFAKTLGTDLKYTNSTFVRYVKEASDTDPVTRAQNKFASWLAGEPQFDGLVGIKQHAIQTLGVAAVVTSSLHSFMKNHHKFPSPEKWGNFSSFEGLMKFVTTRQDSLWHHYGSMMFTSGHMFVQLATFFDLLFGRYRRNREETRRITNQHYASAPSGDNEWETGLSRRVLDRIQRSGYIYDGLLYGLEMTSKLFKYSTLAGVVMIGMEIAVIKIAPSLIASADASYFKTYARVVQAEMVSQGTTFGMISTGLTLGAPLVSLGHNIYHLIGSACVERPRHAEGTHRMYREYTHKHNTFLSRRNIVTRTLFSVIFKIAAIIFPPSANLTWPEFARMARSIFGVLRLFSLFLLFFSYATGVTYGADLRSVMAIIDVFAFYSYVIE